ncbi:low molecular weight phosphotyrosine protein phosphatase [Thiomicrorhabdus sp. ZW0627]|uniref:low molecular weight protein-tyrosine-phosphatase n=1 Tax=Thiomicrorhabdus sp. ZW0627 TaxID=3039774 RepID=UPI0024365722|nr:low molecular weight phosphotyrosine protein phosphatase [Thiomicrorhabdus sp. ZW0627]MDG6774641.1 low molecular weight phosphotyrosine protein phosphatase [Thiomicrorhabdus sp. ZW0627]
MSKKIKVLFVCMGNICRSPTAHAVFRKLVRDNGLEKMIEIDSAGTHAYHVGNPPDSRSMQVARGRGIEMKDLRARQVDFGDFIQYDYVLAMDHANYGNLKDLALPEHFDKISMFLDFAENFSEVEVPDPYYGGPQGFDLVFDMVTDASEGLLRHIREEHLQDS